MIAAVIALVVAAVVIFRSFSSTRMYAVEGLPPTYAMGCMSCEQRFEMPSAAYRRALAGRSDRYVNRIRCPQCGADSAAYRTDSGMDGLGEIGPDGGIDQRFPAGRED
jgi:DNA-directed RNA polymerase subunit RPC12/RpoP